MPARGRTGATGGGRVGGVRRPRAVGSPGGPTVRRPGERWHRRPAPCPGSQRCAAPSPAMPASGGSPLEGGTPPRGPVGHCVGSRHLRQAAHAGPLTQARRPREARVSRELLWPVRPPRLPDRRPGGLPVVTGARAAGQLARRSPETARGTAMNEQAPTGPSSAVGSGSSRSGPWPMTAWVVGAVRSMSAQQREHAARGPGHLGQHRGPDLRQHLAADQRDGPCGHVGVADP